MLKEINKKRCDITDKLYATLCYIWLAAKISIRFDESSKFAFLNNLDSFEFFRNASRLHFLLFFQLLQINQLVT